LQGAFTVNVAWDAEAKVWYIAESDFPGLVAEASSLEGIIEKIHTLLPELAELNAHLLEGRSLDELPVHIMAQRNERVRRAA
jgi:Domain of unknown function (DUF1902)